MPPITNDQLLEAYAANISAYYDAEQAFVRDPNIKTLGAYHRALDRLVVLRRETAKAAQVGDALHAREIEEQTDRAETLLAQVLEEREAAAAQPTEDPPVDPMPAPPVEDPNEPPA